MKSLDGLKQIEVQEPFKAHGQNYFKGERIFDITPEDCERWCAAGWVKDLSGEIPTGELLAEQQKLDVQNGVHEVSAPEVGRG